MKPIASLGILVLGFVGAALALGGCEDDEAAAQIERGRLLYGEYCALCHADQGQGYAADNANALSNQEFLAIASDALIREGIARGRPGTPMSPWGEQRGGPLNANQLDDLTAFIRAWQTQPGVDLTAYPVGAGATERGEAVYDVYCLDCHGDRGEGGEYMSVAHPEFLVHASDAFLRYVIANGRGGTTMPSFKGELSNQALDDVVALIRSWQRPVDSGPFVPPSKDLGDPILNPNGEEPGFLLGERFVSVADLKEAYDAKARMLLLDARPPYDYVANHISGAVSVPFYDVEAYLDQLPKDVWIVAYCACPHAESGAAADVLLSKGYTKVIVLDEGLPLWEEQGYPMTAGTKP